MMSVLPGRGIRLESDEEGMKASEDKAERREKKLCSCTAAEIKFVVRIVSLRITFATEKNHPRMARVGKNKLTKLQGNIFF